MILINEIFETIQGEAAYTGTPSVFVRLQGCPVGCPWCDTKHTWAVDPANERTPAEILGKVEPSPTYGQATAEQLVDLIVERFTANHIVFTGGEPALYDLAPVSLELLDRGYTVQVETSGTHMLSVDARAWVTVSPKYGMPGGFEVMRHMLARANEIKLPFGKEADIALALEAASHTLHGTPIWLQPLSMSPKATVLATHACIKHGFKLSLQTHQYVGIR